MKQIVSFGIIAFKKNEDVRQVLNQIHLWAIQNEKNTIFHPCCKSQLPPDSCLAKDEKELIEKSEVLVSVGGDGTFLAVAHMVKFTEKPVIGINLGGLGFLTDIGHNNLEAHLDKIANGEYSTVNRMVIKAIVVRNKKEISKLHALNDIYINRFDKPKLTSISAWYGNDYITDFQADGIIVSTPSGSTAYSLAAGGPIIEPSVRAFLVNPICPHSLTERPIILPSEKNIRLKINQKNPDLILCADGLDSIRLQCDDEIVISYEGDKTNLIQLTERPYFELLRTKLRWGQDRNRWRNE